MDSDVYKWLEAVSYDLANFPDPESEAMADQAIDLLAAAQQEDGYLNSFWCKSTIRSKSSIVSKFFRIFHFCSNLGNTIRIPSYEYDFSHITFA